MTEQSAHPHRPLPPLKSLLCVDVARPGFDMEKALLLAKEKGAVLLFNTLTGEQAVLADYASWKYASDAAGIPVPSVQHSEE